MTRLLYVLVLLTLTACGGPDFQNELFAVHEAPEGAGSVPVEPDAGPARVIRVDNFRASGGGKQADPGVDRAGASGSGGAPGASDQDAGLAPAPTGGRPSSGGAPGAGGALPLGAGGKSAAGGLLGAGGAVPPGAGGTPQPGAGGAQELARRLVEGCPQRYELACQGARCGDRVTLACYQDGSRKDYTCDCNAGFGACSGAASGSGPEQACPGRYAVVCALPTQAPPLPGCTQVGQSVWCCS